VPNLRNLTSVKIMEESCSSGRDLTVSEEGYAMTKILRPEVEVNGWECFAIGGARWRRKSRLKGWRDLQARIRQYLG